MPNAIVGQSGGPTSVINSSLAGVFQACQMRGAEHVYGMLHGIQGLLDEKVCDLSERLKSFMNIELLKRTPSSFLGSCRYKLPAPEENEEVYEKLFAILKKLDIQWFFYIGGNDSMDTINKLARYGRTVGSGIRFMGVPKTIDNDLMLTDHTPGYGSAAKYIGVVMKEIIRDATVYGTNFVTIVEVMGRNAGWLTAAAALARGEDCEGVDLICLPELPFHTDRFLAKVERMQKERASVVIAVSEGVKLPDGRFVCEPRNLPTRTRSVELSILQRCAGHLTSRTDITEAFQVGGAAAKAAFEGVTAKMVALKRLSNDPYQCTTELVDIDAVANYEKKVPVEWINEARTDMLPEFLAYARPLIQAELTPIYINGLTQHIVEE